MNESVRLDRRFWLNHALWPGLAFVMLAGILELSDIDRALAALWFNADTGQWLARNSWWAQSLFHHGGRWFTGIVMVSALLLWLASFLMTGARRWRVAAGYVVLAMGLATAVPTLLKSYTNVACPWDISAYGGTRPYVRLFDPRPPDLPQVRCFPSGHASAGYAFLAFYFIVYGASRRRTGLALGLALGLGLLYGFAQQARGAHFLSHDLWSAMLCWFICLGIYGVLRRWYAPPFIPVHKKQYFGQFCNQAVEKQRRLKTCKHRPQQI
jgi:membrane-associated PAP2 superfamily phosphatase